jgi:hypothetical protein
MDADPVTAHSEHSALREIILEHAFVADMLRYLWGRRTYDVEVLRSEFDAGGYDLVVSRGEIVRHVQLKAKPPGGSTRQVPVAERLVARESGCVLGFVVADDLCFDHYLWFGARPGKSLPIEKSCKRARHTKADATGKKAERRQHVLIPFSRFAGLETMEEVVTALLGPLPAA